MAGSHPKRATSEGIHEDGACTGNHERLRNPTRSTGQRNQGRPRRKTGANKESTSGPETIKSPYRSRNPRKQRTRSDGNIGTSQRTRPVAQSPEAGRCQCQPLNKGTERSQDLRQPPRMRRSPDQRRHRATSGGQALPRRERRGDGYRRGKSFEGCSRQWERPSPKNPQGNRGWSPKHGGPQDRQRGATNPQGSLRSKPSGRRETVKVERDLFFGRNRPKRGPESEGDFTGRRAREWTQKAQVDGGAIFGNPKRGARPEGRAAKTGKRLQAGGDDIPAVEAARLKRQRRLEVIPKS